MNTITKADLVAAVAHKTGEDTAAVKRIINALTSEIACRVSDGDQVVIRDFGRFYSRLSKRNHTSNLPTSTGKLATPTIRPKFRPGQAFAVAVAESTPVNLTPAL